MGPRDGRQKREARREALEGAAAARTTARQAQAPSTPTEQRNRARPRWPLVGAAAAALIGLAILAAIAWNDGAQRFDASASSAIVVGEPGGEVALQTASPTSPPPTDEPVPSPTPVTTPSQTPMVTPAPEPAGPPPATPATPAIPAPLPSSAPPDPTPLIVAVAQPDDTVAAFYSNVASADFGRAYGLWSERMKATYPRQENLDDRFARTARISFHELFVAAQGEATATVQANFTETYDSGASREFIGYWELIRVESRWLLDAPHY